MPYDDVKSLVNIVSKTLSLTGWNLVIGFNARRIALILPSVGTTPIIYSWSGNTPIPAPATPPGMSVPEEPLIIRRCDVGSIIAQELYASDGGIGSTVAITEIIDPNCGSDK